MTDEKRLTERLEGYRAWFENEEPGSPCHGSIGFLLEVIATRDAEIAAKDAEIERLRYWVARLNNREATARLRAQPAADPACHDCGRRYDEAEGFFDLVIDNTAWKKIAPDNGNGLLCPCCLLKRLHAAGIECAGKFTSGPLATFSAQPAADDVERARDVVKGIERQWLENSKGAPPEAKFYPVPINNVLVREHIAAALTAKGQDARRQALEEAAYCIKIAAQVPDQTSFEWLIGEIRYLADKPAAPDITALVRALRRAVESTSVGDPLKMPEWRALCAAMNEIDAAGGGR